MSKKRPIKRLLAFYRSSEEWSSRTGAGTASGSHSVCCVHEIRASFFCKSDHMRAFRLNSTWTLLTLVVGCLTSGQLRRTVEQVLQKEHYRNIAAGLATKVEHNNGAANFRRFMDELTQP